jgi:hypothetical protein
MHFFAFLSLSLSVSHDSALTRHHNILSFFKPTTKTTIVTKLENFIADDDAEKKVTAPSDNKKHHEHHDKFVPTKLPANHENDTSDMNSDEDDDDEMHKVEVPFYPTIDGKPPKVPQEKPHKKFHGKDNKGKEHGAFMPTPPNYDNNKYHSNNNNFENPNGAGPGFFNPDATKNQYPDLTGSDHPLPVDKQLFNILGHNPQNLPPHVRIDQLLQHIQGQDHQNQGPLLHGQNINLPFQPVIPNGINYNQFGENQDHIRRPGHLHTAHTHLSLYFCEIEGRARELKFNLNSYLRHLLWSIKNYFQL